MGAEIMRVKHVTENGATAVPEGDRPSRQRQQKRQLLRLLKRLNASPQNRLSVDGLPPAMRGLVKLASSDGLACLEAGGFCRLTEAGSAALKRLLHPDHAFAAQHGDWVGEGVSSEGSPTAARPRRNLAESVLDRLARQPASGGEPWLSAEHREAGERLRGDFEKAQLQPRLTANWLASVASRGGRHDTAHDISDLAVDARKRLDAAIEAMGPELSGIALDLCCFLKGLETVERERQWPPRSAKLMLRTALQALSRHYGLQTKGGRRKTGHWGAEGYRPSIR